ALAGANQLELAPARPRPGAGAAAYAARHMLIGERLELALATRAQPFGRRGIDFLGFTGGQKLRARRPGPRAVAAAQAAGDFFVLLFLHGLAAVRAQAARCRRPAGGPSGPDPDLDLGHAWPDPGAGASGARAADGLILRALEVRVASVAHAFRRL